MPIDPRGIAVISGSGANFRDTKFRSLDNGAHYFSGSLTISSSAAGGDNNATGLSLSASGKISASYFYGDGSNLSGVGGAVEAASTSPGDTDNYLHLTFVSGAGGSATQYIHSGSVSYNPSNSTFKTVNIVTTGDVTLGDDLIMDSDSAVISMGDDADVTLTHVADTGVLLNSTRQLQFGDSGTFINQGADGQLDLTSDGQIDMNVGAAGVIVKGTTPKVTIGDAGAEDTFLVFDGNAQDYRIGLDDGTDKLEIGLGATHGTTTAMTIDANQQVAITATTAATSTSTGALTVAGGASVAADLYVGDDLELDSDGAKLGFGADSDTSLTHVADTGILLNSTRQLQFGDSGTYIHQSADGVLDLVSDTEIEINATTIDINGAVDASSTITAAGRVIVDDTTEATSTTDGSLQTDGGLSVAKDAVLGNDVKMLSDAAVLNMGADSDVSLTHVADTGILLNSSRQLQFGDSGTYIHQSADGVLDLVSDTEIEINATTIDVNGAIDASSTITAAGRVIIDDATDATSTTDGSLQTDGGLSVAKDAVLGNDVKMLSDAAVLNMGADSDVSLTHVADTGILLNSSRQLQFGDSGTYIHQSADGVLDLVSDTEIEINATTIDMNGAIDASSTITAAGRVIVDDATDATTTTDGSLQTDGGLSVAKDAVLGNDVKMLSDAAVLNMGADSDVSLTHVADTGILLNSSRQLQFGDSGTYIHQSADGVLDLVSDTEIEINATTIDMNGAIDASSTITAAGRVIVDDATDATSTTDGSLQTDGGLSVAKDAVLGNDVKLLSDGAVLSFGAGSPTTITHNASDDSLSLNNGLTVGGSLTVQGSVTYVSSSNTVMKDSLIVLNSGSSDADNGATNINDVGLIMKRGAATDAALFWDESADRFQIATLKSGSLGDQTGNLAFDSAPLSASAMHAQAFHGDGSNLTGISADTITTADGGNNDATVYLLGSTTAAGSGASILTDGQLVYNNNTNTLTVTKLGAYEQAGAVDFSDEEMTNVNIDSGAIDGTAIGANSASTAKFTTISGSSTLQIAGATSLGNNLSVEGNISGSGTLNVAGNMSGSGTLSVQGGAALGSTLTVEDNVEVEAGNLTVTLGNVVVSAGSTTVQAFSAEGNVDLGNAASDTVTVTGQFDSDLVPSTDSARDLGSSTKQWAEAHIDHGYIDAITATGTSTLTTVDINGGAIDGTAIGANSATTAKFTTISGSSTLQIAGATSLGNNLSVEGAISGSGNMNIAGNMSGSGTLSVQGAAALGSTLTVEDNVEVEAGNLTVTLGNLVVSAGSTTVQALSAEGNVDLGNATSDTITATGQFDSDLVPSTDSARDLGTSTKQWAEAHVDHGYIDDITATGTSTLTTVDINGGAIDGTTIGAASAAAATVTTLTATTSNLGTLGSNVDHANYNSTNVDIDSGAIDGTVIGANSAAAGTFTTLSVTGDLTVTGTTTYVSSSNTVMKDSLIVLNSGSSDADNGATNINDVGLIMKRGAATDAAMFWDESADRFQIATLKSGSLGTQTGNLSFDSAPLSASAMHAKTFHGDGSNLTGVGASVAQTDGAEASDTLTFALVSASAASSANLYYDSGITFDQVNNTLTVTKLGAYEQAGAVNFSDEAMTNVNIDSGAIDGAVIGANSAAAATVTTLSATGDVDLGDATSDTITATGRFDSDLVPSTDSARDLGTSALQWAEAHIDHGYIDAITATGTSTLTTVDINGGAIDGTAIGANSATTAKFTTISGSSTLQIAGATSLGNNLSVEGAISGSGNMNIAGNMSGSGTLSVQGATALGSTLTVEDNVEVEAGNLTVTLGNLVVSAGSTTVVALSATGDVDLGNATSDTVTVTGQFDSDLIPSTDSARDLGTSAKQWAEAHIDHGYIDDITATGTSTLTTVDINGGAIDGTAIGANSATTAKFTTISGSSTLQIAGATSLGNNLSVEGAISGSGALNVAGNMSGSGTLSVQGGVALGSTLTVEDNVEVEAGNLTVTSGNLVVNGNVDLGNATSDTITATGQFDSDLIPSTDSARDLGTSAKQWAEAHIDHGYIDAITATGTSTLTTVDINGGAIDGTTIGANSAAAGTFTTLSVTGDLTVTGTTTYVSSSNTVMKDSLIVLNSGSSDADNGATNINDVGLIMKRGAATDAALFWDESADRFQIATLKSGSLGSQTGNLSFDSAPLSASHVHAQFFTGDGSNLTGISADTITTADGGDNDATVYLLGSTTAAGSGASILTDGQLVYNNNTNTLTVTKLGAYEQAGAVDFSDEEMTNVNIDSGAIDGTAIGANSASTAKFTTISGSSTLQIAGATSLGNNLSVEGNISGSGTLNVAGNMSGSGTLSVQGGVDMGSTLTVEDNVTVEAGNLTVTLGNVVVSAGSTTVQAFSAEGNVDLGNAASDTITATGQFDSDLVPSTDSARDLGSSTKQWAEAHIDHGYIDAITATGTSTLTTVDINGGAIDGTTIGAASAAAGTFTTVAGTTGTFSGILKTDDTTEATSTTDGSLQTDGGLSVAKDAVLGNDVKMLSDAAVLNMGADSDVSLTHVADTGILLNSSRQLQFGDSGTYIHQSADGVLDLVSDTEIEINATTIDINGAVDASSTITAAGRVIVDDATEATSTTDGSLQTDGGLSVAKSAVVGDDLDLLSDAAIVNFGADKDVNLTHVADTGLLLNSSRQLQFGDSGTYIHQSADGVLDLVSDTEIEINATTIDINGAVDMSSNLTVNGNLTVKGTTTYVSSSNTVFYDNLIMLNSGSGDTDNGATNINDTGLVLKRGAAVDALFIWDESADRFQFGLTTSASLGDATGNVSFTSAPLSASHIYASGSTISTLTVQGDSALGSARTDVTTVTGLLSLTHFRQDNAADVNVLDTMAAAPGAYNGSVIYIVSGSSWASADAITQQTFGNVNKWYFCENGEWYPSPFASDL